MDALLLDDETTSVEMGPFIEILEDPSGQLSIEDILNNKTIDSFQPVNVENPNFGFTSSSYWVKVNLSSKLDHKSSWFLEIDYPPLDNVSLFYKKEGDYLEKISGDGHPFAQRDIQYHNVVFVVELLPKQTQTIYLKFQTSGSMQLPLVLWKPTSFTEKVNTENYIFGIYCGIMLVVIFYNLFLFISVRDYSYLHYVLYVLFFTSIQLVLFGFAYEHLWPNSPWLANHSLVFSLVFSLAGTMLFIALFSSSFLHMRRYAPRSHQCFMAVALISIILMLLSLVIPYRISIILNASLALMLTPLPLFTGMVCLRAGYRPAGFYLFAWMFLLFGCIAFILKSFGLAPTNVLTTYGAQIGSAIEVILLSLALGDRINYERKEKYQAKIQSMNNLEKSDRLKDAFMATISHELRTPLNGVSCSLALIEEANRKGLDIADSIAEAENSAYLMQSLIDDLLCFTEAKNEELEVTDEHFNLLESLKPSINYYQAQCIKKGIEFNISTDELSRHDYLGDKKKLIKVLNHLMDNAVKFTEKGAVSLELKCLSDVKMDSDKKAFLFSVKDTGAGIPESKQAVVYDAFSQVDNSFTRNYGGLGIGLAICMSFVKAMGGAISFTSKPNDTRFDVVLYFGVDAGFKGSSDESVHIDEARLSVLIIEDNPVNQALMAKMVTNMGHEIVKAENGQLGLDAFKQNAFDIILMDCQMPVMDGYEATQAIRMLNPTIPIIAVTANALEKDRQHCFDVGMNDFVAKPIQKGALEKVIRYWANVE